MWTIARILVRGEAPKSVEVLCIYQSQHHEQFNTNMHVYNWIKLKHHETRLMGQLHVKYNLHC